MSWFYVCEDQRRGPVEPSDFERLVQQGVISKTTLVWREGMANWQPYQEVVPGGPPPADSPASGPDTVLCSECGRSFAADQVVRFGNRVVCAECKPLVVQKLQEGVVDTDVEQIRKQHIEHEASVRSVGFLYFLGAAFCLLMSLPMMGVTLATSRARAEGMLFGIFFLLLGALQIWTGVGLRRLRPWARIPSGILSGIGLLGFPLGTLINVYILYLLFSKKGSMVFSASYKTVIEQTPHIKYRTSMAVWVVLGILLVTILIGVLFAIFG